MLPPLRPGENDGGEHEQAERRAPGNELVGFDSPPGQPRDQEPPGPEGAEHGHIDPEQAGRCLDGRVASDADHPGHGPEGLDGHHAAVVEKSHRCHAPEVGMTPDLGITSARGGRRGGCLPARHLPGDPRHGQQQHQRQPPEQGAPAVVGQQPLHRECRRHHAHGAGHAHPGVRAQLAHRIEPATVARQRCHQAGRQTDTAKHTGQQQTGETARQGKGHTARNGHGQETEDHALRPMPVQPAPQRQLQGCETQEIAAGQQAEITRIERKFLGQLWRERCRHRPHQGRKKVGEGKGQEDQDGATPVQHAHWRLIPPKKGSLISTVMRSAYRAAWYRRAPRTNQTACTVRGRPSGPRPLACR